MSWLARLRLATPCVLALAAAVPIEGACTTTQLCCGACPASRGAAFQLTCASTDLATVTATGPCASDATTSPYVNAAGVLWIDSDSTGVCHVVLTFASGFTFAADVTFASQPGGVCGGPQCTCPDFVAPTTETFAVNNPDTTCVDAGSDAAAAADAEAGP